METGDQLHSMVMQAVTATAPSSTYDAAAETAAATKVMDGDYETNASQTAGGFDAPASTGTMTEFSAITVSQMNAKQYGKKGLPFQVRFVSGLSGSEMKIVKRQMFIPHPAVVFNGDTVEVDGIPGGGSKKGWVDLDSGQNFFIRITIDGTVGDWCSKGSFEYRKPGVKAEWKTQHEETKVSEGKIEYSVAVCTEVPMAVGGSVDKTHYNHVSCGAIKVVDPFEYLNHVVSMDVVTDLRFEDSGTEIKCHVTRAKIGCVKLFEEDATPKEDYKTKGEDFSKQDDSEIPRVLKLYETRMVANGSFQQNALTQQVVEKIRVIGTKSGADPSSITTPTPKTETVFTASAHSSEHV